MGPSEIALYSALPIVDLNAIDTPLSGVVCATPKYCERKFTSDRKCREHYERLRDTSELDGELIICPYGFSSMAMHTATCHWAITGFIPFPRQGAAKERERAKHTPNNKVAREGVFQAARILRRLENIINSLEAASVERTSVALHEIRKLNRTVKQSAERMCLEENSADPDAANPALVQIWKSAELMSHQFDVIELLANEGLVSLPLKSQINVYRIFDKCVRIYRQMNPEKHIELRSSGDPTLHQVWACDKTFPMIPTVLIENAVKYSLPNTAIVIDVKGEKPDKCEVQVVNSSAYNSLITQNIFNRGVRASRDKEGSGNGLYLAQLVAQQHEGMIEVSTQRRDKDRMDCIFTVRLLSSNNKVDR